MNSKLFILLLVSGSVLSGREPRAERKRKLKIHKKKTKKFQKSIRKRLDCLNFRLDDAETDTFLGFLVTDNIEYYGERYTSYNNITHIKLNNILVSREALQIQEMYVLKHA